ncbi:Chaperone protein DnaK [Frankliniella fusca]|uniref:Hypoxia up-regulated protein 1 n=1 Tax=Frankliniella fusca TaxID=407009 RepID=A0AAE1GW35_9NEOP|nr:Chaperone protein DnaK [Frankliniella fusca]
MEKALGIDFGTAYCVVAELNDGFAVVLENDVNQRSTPTCATVPGDSNEQWQFGESAVRLEVCYPVRTILRVKQHLGSVEDKILSNSIRPESVVAEILKFVLSTPLNFKRAALSIPAYFNASQKESFLTAVSDAGIEEIVLVDDVAAALASYAYSRNTNKTVVMVDSGAGGSSVAVASVKGNQVHLLQLSRLHLPGGDHFDSIMVDFIKDRILRNMNVRVSSTRDNIILRQYWEEAKRKLSRIPSTAIKAFLPDAYVEVNEEVSRLDFEGVCHDLIVSIVNEVMKTVTTSEVNEEDIQNVVLLGGSARVPHLRHLLQTALNRANISLFDPDEAVAKGLVLIGNFQVEISQQWVEKKSSWFTGCPLISSSLSPHKPYEDADQIDEGISMYVGFPLIAQDASAGNPTTVQDGRSPSVTGAREGDTQHLSMKTTSPEPWTEHRDVENSRPKSACSSAHSHVGRESQFSDKLGGETPLQFSPQRDDSDDLLHPDVEGCSSKPFGSESPFSDMLGSETPLEGCPPPDDNHDAPNRDAQKCSDQLDRTSRNDDIDSDLQTDNKATAETEKKITEREGQYQVDLNEVLLYRKTRRYPSRLRGKCNREGWTLSKNVESDTEDDDPDPFDMEKFKESLRPMDRFREEIDLAVEGNIKKAQDRQRRGYNKRHAGGKILKEGDEVFLINQRRRDRKGGNYEMPRSGPYIIVEISDRKNVTLKNKNGLILKNKYPLLDLEPYIIPPEREMKRATRPDTGGGDEKKGSTHEHEDAIQHTDKSNSEIQNNKIDANDTDEEVDTQKPVLLHQYTIDTDTDDTDKGVDIQKPVILNQNTIDTDDTDEEVQTQKPVLNYPREIGKEELNEFLKMEESTEILCIKGYKITTAELLMIHDKHWLNDMIINAYFDIICEVTNKGKVHFLSTFFMQKLSSSLSEAQKWTKNVSIYSKVNIFEFKTLLVPIHGRSNTHWSLCAIDNDEHSITYFDSLRCNVREESDAEMEAIHNFLKAEYSRKGNGLLPPYSKNYAQNPYQTDSCDCGVFVCFFGRRLAEGRSCQAPSSHISNMRQQMAVELLAAKLLPENSWKVTLHEFVTSDGLDVSYSVKAQSGIQNLGNTCFISATLQLLFHCEPLLKVLKAAAPLADAKTITKELITAYDEYCNGNVLVPSELVKVVTGVLPRYRSGRQYDAEEFLNFLLQHISGEFEECARTFQATMNVKGKLLLESLIDIPPSNAVRDGNSRPFTADGKKVSNVVRQNMRLKASEVGYDFVGAISHLGASGASSHYVATVKVADKLIHFDDDKRTLRKTVSSMQKLNKEQAYVVMYCKTAEKKY